MTYRINMIPQHCIDLFFKNFNCYPSIIEYNGVTNANKFLEKYRLVWFKNIIDNVGVKPLESFYEYDSTGIMVYLNQEGTIFILTTVDRKNVSEFLINSLKKLK